MSLARQWKNPEKSAANASCTLCAADVNEAGRRIYDRKPVLPGNRDLDAWANRKGTTVLERRRPNSYGTLRGGFAGV